MGKLDVAVYLAIFGESEEMKTDVLYCSQESSIDWIIELRESGQNKYDIYRTSL
jgi:hypothetical protein